MAGAAAAMGNATSDIFTYQTLLRTGKSLLKKIWLLLAVSIAFFAIFFAGSAIRYEEEYRSEMVIALTTGTYVTSLDENGNPVRVLSNQKIYDESDANKYLALLRSDYIVDKIVSEVEQGTDKNEVRHSLTISKASNSGIFKISANNSDRDLCKKALGVVNKEFPTYLKQLDPSLGVVVVNSPQEPVIANKYQSLKTAGVGLLLGIFLVVAGVYITELVRDTVRSSDDARVKLNARFLGSIPSLEQYERTKLNKKIMRGPLLSNENTVSFAFVESFKTIRAKVESTLNDYNKNVFAVTSTLEGEGKTTVTVNLACALAQAGKSVLLIECDLRRPSVLKMVGIREEGKKGVIQVVEGTTTCEESIKFVRSLGLFLLPSGGTTNRASEIIGSRKFGELIERVSEEFDYVVIDTPPSRVVSDCLTMAPVVDCVVYAVREDYAKVNDIVDSIGELEIAGANVLGVALTMSAEENSGYYAASPFIPGLKSKKSNNYYYGINGSENS